MFARRGNRDDVERLRRVLLGPDPRTDAEKIAAYLELHPDASTNQVLRDLRLRLRRTEALSLVKTLKGSAESTLALASPGNRVGTGSTAKSESSPDAVDAEEAA